MTKLKNNNKKSPMENAGNMELRRQLNALDPKTMDSYRKLAENFYKKRLTGQKVTPKTIADALKAASADYRPDYWRKLRNALAYDQIEKKYCDAARSLSAVKNTITSPPTTAHKRLMDKAGVKVKQKQKRLKKVNQDDLERIKNDAAENGHVGVQCALKIAEITGCRPAEMLNIECRENGTIFIPGAKQTQKGNRGLDRLVIASDADFNDLKLAVGTLKSLQPGKAGTMHKVQSQLDRINKKIWPRRKINFTLYTVRHQFGSVLKSSKEFSREEIAYLMGHQSTQSVEIYGDSRSAQKGSKSPIKPAPGAKPMELVRNKTKEFGKARTKTPGTRHAPASGPGLS